MNDPELERALDEATAGLTDDPELRLDVRRELQTHVEEALEEAEGATEAERLHHALKALGHSTELAGALAEGNRQRMKVRALVRMFLRWLLVPVAVAMALFILLHDLIDFRILARSVGLLEGSVPSQGRGLFRGLSAEQVFLFTGDRSRPDAAAQQRAIWEREPANPMYFGNYISQLLSGGDVKDPKFTLRLEEELRRGESLDPENARYPYLLAGALFESGSNWEGGREENSRELVVTDPACLDRALQALRSARSKPEYRRYCLEMNRKRLGMLKEPRDLMDTVERISVSAAIVLPDLQLLRNIIRVLPPCAERLAADGRTDEAIELLATWSDLMLKLNDESFTLIDNLVVGAMAKQVQEKVPPVLVNLGRPHLAGTVRAEAERLGRPVEAWRERREAAASDDVADFLHHRAGAMARVILPALGEEVSDEQLRHGRELDFVMAERVLLICVNVFLLVLMAGAAIVWARWRRVPGAASAPFLLVPPLTRCAWVFAAGVVLPVVAFYIYSRWSGLGGRGYALMFMPCRFIAEYVLLGSTVLFATSAIASGFIRTRCRELGVATPFPRSAWRRAFGILAIAGWLACLAVREQTVDWGQSLALGVGLVVAVGLVFGLFAMFLKSVFGHAEYGLYYGTWGRSLVPVYASAIILSGLLSYPYLSRTEARLVREDPLIVTDPEGGFTSVEARLSARLKGEVREAAVELRLR